MDLNDFIAKLIGIVPPWTVLSVEFNGPGTVDVLIGYDRDSGPSVPRCSVCGGEAGYCGMADMAWRHTDLCDFICIIRGRVPCVECKACGAVSRIGPPWEKIDL